MTAPDPQVAAWEARPADPDGCVERMARAMWDEQIRDLPNAVPWENTFDASKQTYRRLAVAALQVVKAPADDGGMECGITSPEVPGYGYAYCERKPGLDAALTGGAQ